MSIFTSRILVPLVYYPFYFLLVFGLVTKNVTKLHRNHALILLIIFFIYIIHLPNVKDLSSNFIYTCLWVINILISAFIFNLKNTAVIEKSLACFGIILIASFIPLNFLGIHPANYYGNIGFNINLVVFFITFSIFYFFKIYKSYKVSKYFLLSISLLTGSRMHILMYLAYIGMRYRFILYLSLLFIVISVIYVLPSISIYSDVANYFLTGQFSFTEKFDDTRRIYLGIAAIESLKNTFPLGSGFGLENYVQFAGIGIGDVYSGEVRLSMSHNFYLSYLAISGVFFIPLFLSIIMPVFRSNSDYKYLYIMFLIGIAFNEYITSPIFWVVHGLMLRNDKIR